MHFIIVHVCTGWLYAHLTSSHARSLSRFTHLQNLSSVSSPIFMSSYFAFLHMNTRLAVLWIRSFLSLSLSLDVVVSFSGNILN